MKGTLARKSTPSPIQFGDLLNAHHELILDYQNKRIELQKLYETHKADHTALILEIGKRLEYLDKLIAQVYVMQKGEKGDTPIAGVHYPIPKDGVSVDHEKVVQDVLAKIPQPKDGKDAVIDDKLIARIAKLTKGKDGKAPTLDEVVKHIKENLTVEHIPGLKREIDLVHNQLAGKIYGKDTLIRGGGDTVEAGTNITITKVNGKSRISSSGGGGILTPTGAVDGSNTVFVFASTPSIITVDNGRAMQKVSSDGTVNWTGTTTVTLTVAPTFDIFGM